ncbi:hypothetical protein BN2475_710059 [Paraburkholderia ribeironis]|uniref:Uncharacterized protein n=1 Tax=Paraburkholderia ribeironis TaxID=1247936 RepID=A0A1N7SI73_9BURK|nr:hypothetical protein BN2475_710059 [Paraburkholderia ribeironis]
MIRNVVGERRSYRIWAEEKSRIVISSIPDGQFLARQSNDRVKMTGFAILKNRSTGILRLLIVQAPSQT